MAEIEVTTVPTQIPTPLNVTALAKRFGVARRTIQRRLRKGWTPPAVAPKRPGKVRQVSHPDVAAVSHSVPHQVPQPVPPDETAWLCPPALLQPEPDVMPHSRGLRVLTLTVAIGLAAVAAYFSISGMVILFPGSTAIEEAAKRGRGKSAMTLADDQRRNRDTLVAQRQREAATLVSLKTDQAQVTAESRRVEADIGPLQYAATLLGLDREQAIRLLILLMVLCCDPMAIVLVIAASARHP
jgi:hypothetical protein